MKNKNSLEQIIRDALAQPSLKSEAEHERQFTDWLDMLHADIAAGIRGPRCASYRMGRKMIAAHLKS